MQETTSCSCAFKTQMMESLRSRSRQAQGEEAEGLKLLFDTQDERGESSLCCVLTCLFYYAYCNECGETVSDMARRAISGLMESPVVQ